MGMAEFAGVFDKLRQMDIDQYSSYISASQYLKSYYAVNKHVEKGGRVLDWGAGNGRFSYFLLEQGYKVTAFNVGDGDRPLEKIMKENFSGKYEAIADKNAVAQIPFDSNFFDAVCSIGVLEHVRETGGDEVKSLREIHRVLKQGGVFICTHLPNKYSWIEALTKRMKNKHHHDYKYTKKDVEKMAQSAGFEIIEYKRYGFLPRLMFGKFKTAAPVADAFNMLDDVLSAVFSLFVQNQYFVAVKK